MPTDTAVESIPELLNWCSDTATHLNTQVDLILEKCDVRDERVKALLIKIGNLAGNIELFQDEVATHL